MANPVSHTPVWHGPNHDGNGLLSEIEKKQGFTLKPNSDGKTWTKVGPGGKKLATLADSSATKQLEKHDEADKRISKLEKGQTDIMAMLKELLNKGKEESK